MSGCRTVRPFGILIEIDTVVGRAHEIVIKSEFLALFLTNVEDSTRSRALTGIFESLGWS